MKIIVCIKLHMLVRILTVIVSITYITQLMLIDLNNLHRSTRRRPDRKRKSLYLSEAICRDFQAAVGGGAISPMLEELMLLFVQANSELEKKKTPKGS